MYAFWDGSFEPSKLSWLDIYYVMIENDSEIDIKENATVISIFYDCIKWCISGFFNCL